MLSIFPVHTDCRLCLQKRNQNTGDWDTYERSDRDWRDYRATVAIVLVSANSVLLLRS